jgi:predicted O-methyltransferase YrrM
MNSVLRELFETHIARDPDGREVAMHSNIARPYAEALYRVVLDSKPVSVVEIGMAFGITSLTILSALEEIGGDGKLISIDPHQSTQWKNCGIAAVRRAGLDARHKLIEDFNYSALPKLLESGQAIDFAYIDGWHTFDYALLDFWYLDRMLKTGGVVGFNDCGFPAVDKVLRFLVSHRRYTEIDVGLSYTIIGYSRMQELRRRVFTNQSVRDFYRQAQDRYFTKVESWEPDWDYYSEF